MFKLYPDTEKELYFDIDYKPIENIIANLDNTGLIELLDNLYSALDNAYCYNAALLENALYDDIVTVKKHILINCIKSYSSGTIAGFIDNTKYTEIDNAVNKTLFYLFNTEDENIFPLSVDMEGIKNLVCTCYHDKTLQ